jgi:uncharacterized protein with von Willebrand factor type A (vWA) domain
VTDSATLAAFVAELRAIGLPVSMSENVDAMAAVLAMPITSRSALRSALAATLIKNGAHTSAFDLVFEVFFGDRRMGAAVDDGGIVAALSDEDLADLLFRAISASDRTLMRAAVAEAVTRHAGVVPGRAVAGMTYLYRTLRRIGLDGMLERLIESDIAALPAELDRHLAAGHRRRQVAEVQAEIEAEIRRRLVADRGADAVARTLRTPLPDDVNFVSASADQLAALRMTVQLLGRKMAARVSHKRRHHHRSTLDFRRTIRQSLAYGGVPAELAFRRPRPAKPEIMLVADVSSSVSAFASFTLQLAYAIRSEFSRVRSFAFTDGIEEVTGILEAAPDIAAAARDINKRDGIVRLDGHSDYGMALEDFWNRWGPQIRSRTSVIILGDARNNQHAAQSWVLKAIQQKARHLYWLNPEPRFTWDIGDSIISEYEAFCDQVIECQNIRQLKEFVEMLD